MAKKRHRKSCNNLQMKQRKAHAIAYPNTTNDLLFKYVFGSWRGKENTISLLNDVLGDQLSSPVKNLSFIQTEIPMEHMDVKDIRYDISCNLKDGRIVIVEMQVRDEGDIDVRALYYWARRFTYSLKRGQDYSDLPEVISLNILNFIHFQDQTEAFTHSTLVNPENGKIIDDHISINFLELPKFQEHKHLTPLELWMAFLNPTISLADKRRLAMSKPQIQKACDKVEKFFSNDERFQLYEERELAQLDYESSMNNRYKKGRKEGVLNEKQSTVMRMLKSRLPLSTITIASDLSEQAIRDIAKKNGISIA